MSPDLVLFAIKAFIRVGQQANKALIEIGADKDAPFPDIPEFRLRDQQVALTHFLREPRFAGLREEAPFKELWTPANGGRIDPAKWSPKTPDERDRIFEAAGAAAEGDIAGIAILVVDDEQRSLPISESAIGFAVISQWKEDQKPITPIARVVLAVAQVALEYVTINPSIVGIRGSGGEKILKSFASAIAVPLSKELEAEKLGPASQFVEDMLKVLAGAAFDTLKANVGELISDKHLALLVGNALEPVVAAVKTGDLPLQRRMQHVFDALLGPAAAAAMKTVADNPEAFLGSRFDKSKAAGALVSALLVEAAKPGDIRTTFSEQGLIGLLTATLDVAAQKPDLFIKIDDQRKATLLKEVVASVATALRPEVDRIRATRSFDAQRIAGALAASAMEVVGRNAARLIGHDGKAWQQVATDLAKEVLGDIATALQSEDQRAALQRLLSEEQLIDLGRIVIKGVATRPDLLGTRDAELRAVISAVATAIAADKRLLLGPDAWLDLARLLVEEVAARPSVIAGDDKRLQAVVSVLGQFIAGDGHAVLTGGDVTAAARILAAELIGHPALFTGLNSELKIVVGAIARAMAADSNRLLSGADWVELLKVAAAEASANPARLFGLNRNNATESLAADVIGLVLRSIPEALPPGGGLILKGEVLREAITIIVRFSAGGPDNAKKYLPLLQLATKEISELVAANSGRYGSKEWLRLVRVLCASILAGKFDAELSRLAAGQPVKLLATVGAADALLAGGA